MVLSKKKWLHLFHYLTLGIFIVVLNEVLIITDPQYQLQIPELYFMIGSLVSIVWFIFLLDYYSKYYRILNVLLLVLVVLYFLSNVLSLYFTEGTITFQATNLDGITSDFTFHVTLMDRYKSGYFALSSMMMMYLSFQVLPQIFSDRKVHLGFFYLLLATVYGFVIYSAITEWPIYQTLYVDATYPGVNTYSFFSNPNVFGFYITLAIMGLGYIESLRHRWYHYVLMVPLVVALLPTFNITGYVGSIVFLATYFFYDLFANFSQYPRFSAIKLVVTVTVGYYVLLQFALGQTPFFVLFRDQIIPDSIRSFESRYAIWNHGLEIVQGLPFWIGRGVYIAHQLLALAMSVESFDVINRFHNGYLDLLATGGVLKVVLYYSMNGLLLLKIWQWFWINKKMGTTFLGLFLAFHVQSIPEAKVLFEADSMGLISTVLIGATLFVDPKTVTKALRFNSLFE